MQIDVSQPVPGILSLRFNCQYDACATFLRLQEFYESPFKEIKGKFFTLEEYMDRYAKATGNFTYTSDWGGFNVPGHVVREFFTIFRNRLLEKEKDLKVILKPSLRKSDKFYVIGHYENFSKVDWSKEESLFSTTAHEIAHGFFYLDEHYRGRALALVKEMSKSAKKAVEKRLTGTGGYCLEVINDETQAYFATSTDDSLKERFGIRCKTISKKFRNLLLDAIMAHK